VERALEQLPPISRFIILMAQTFSWSETRISAYLQAEGEPLSAMQVREQVQAGYRLLEATLPEDINEIYLDRRSVPSHSLEELSLEPTLD
jgi:hypothetical protein